MVPDPKAAWRVVLAKHFLLRHLEASELDKLLNFARFKRCRLGEVLFQKGDPGEGLLAILSGHIKISTLSASGKEVVLNVLGRGELFGEIALIDGKERSANAVALEPCELVVIDRRDFLPFLEQHPDVTTRLLGVLCERIRWVSDLYEDAVLLNLPARLAKKLLRLARDHGEGVPGGLRIGVRLSQQDLGSMLGATRESINKHLHAWQEEGLIRVERGFITIREPETLELFSHAV